MLRDAPGSPAQRLLVTFLADYQIRLGRAVPSALLVDLLAEFDVTSDATRTALSRLVKGGLLERRKIGRSTEYALSELGVTMVGESVQRILSFGEARIWDGAWTLIAFSVSENEERHLRHQLRTRLRAMGFAPIYDGLWCAAHATIEEARAAVEAAGVSDAMLFRGLLSTTDGSVERFREAWGLDELGAGYQDFLARFAPLRARLRADAVAPAEALVARTRIMDEWRVFPRNDPDLPPEILGKDWPREAARSLFLECYESLAGTAELRLRALMDRYASA